MDNQLANVIELSDGSDSDSNLSPSPKFSRSTAAKKPSTEESQEEEEDEELAELAAAARKRARQQEQENKTSTSNGLAANAESPRPVDTGPNPVIEILVTSNIEGTTALLVKRKWKQNFRDIRKAWLERQVNMPAHIKKEDVYFTWRKKKVFDVASCKSLGVKLDQYGNAVIPNDQGQDRATKERIALCATTDAQQKLEKEEEEEARRKRREEEEAKLESAPPEASQGNNIRIILKARDYPDQRLKVNPVGAPPMEFHAKRVVAFTDIRCDRLR